MRTFKLVSAVVVSAALTVSVAACSSTSGSSSGSASASASSSAEVTTNLTAQDVEVTGFGPTMTVNFPVPSSATELTTRDIKVGTGAAAKVGSSISVNYILKGATSGKVIDQGFGNVPPFQLAKGSLIEGWVQGIPGMKVGGERVLVVPGNLAYGPNPGSPDIAPNETLVFVVQLLAVS